MQRTVGLFLVLVAVVATGWAVCGCQSTGRVSDDSIRQIGYAQLKAMLAASAKHPVALVDVRLPDAFATGHIAGALNIPLPSLATAHGRLAGAEHVVVYGAGWTDDLATAAVKRLMKMGVKSVLHFRGGLETWREAGGPVMLLPTGSGH